MRTAWQVTCGLWISLICCVAAAGQFAYIPNSGSDTVSVIDTATEAVVATVSTGRQPFGVAVNAIGNRVYVANRTSNTVTVIDATTNGAVATIAVGTGPIGVAADPVRPRVYVANGGGTVSVIDTDTNAVLATIPVGNEPFGIAVNTSATRIYVANRSSNSLSVIDPVTNAVVATIDLAGLTPTGVAINASGTRIYVASSTSANVIAINAATNLPVGTIPVLGGAAWAVATNESNTQVFSRTTGDVLSIATPGDGYTIVSGITVGLGPGGVALKPATSRLYVVNSGSNSVSVVDLGARAVVATIPVGAAPLALGQFIGPVVATPPARPPDLNQHGLTGSWYEPATSGQGVELEVYPDLTAPGTGLAFLSWFTYDSVVGGAERQRWYTADGPVVTGQPKTTLTINRNTGGNFNAPPITESVPVGTATLSFDSCTTGTLSYNFTDGTGRTGSIPLSRLTQSMTCSTTGARPTNADFAFSGNWYDPATSGQGVTVEVNTGSQVLFLAWYTYAPNGAGAGAAGQRWYTAEQTTPLLPGARTIPLRFFETTGGAFDTPTNPAPSTVVVGSGTLAFQSCSSATLSYSFTGGSSRGASGAIALKRVGTVPVGCAM